MTVRTPGQQKIIAGLTSLLNRKRLSSIKTSEIINASSVSHQTFYRYFMDKYDAAESACYECLSGSKMIFGSNPTVREQTICLLNVIKSHSTFFKHLLADPEGAVIIKNTLIKLSIDSINFKSSPSITNAWILCLQEWNDSNYAFPVEDEYLKIISHYPIREVVFGDELRSFLEKYGNYTMDELNASCHSENHSKP